MVELKVKIDTRKLDRELKKDVKKLDENTKQTLVKQLENLMIVSKMLAPYDTGRLSQGIMVGKVQLGKYVKKGNITWKELDSRRAGNFKRGQAQKWGNFVAWMHNSKYALEHFRNSSGFPNFFDKALEMNREKVIKEFEQTVNKSIK